jgi:DNA-3-methyladenine glycosylase II
MEIVRRELVTAPPYDLDLVFSYLRTSPSAVAETISVDGVYRRALTLDGRDLLLHLRSHGTVQAPRLILDIEGEHVDGACAERAAQLVRRVFSLDQDPAPFLAAVSGDPVMHSLVERYPGLRPALIADPYEALIWAIIGQQINIAFARRLKAALVEIVGRTLRVGDRTYPLLPTPLDVANLDPKTLRANQFSRQKINYLIDVSRAVVTGELDFAVLRDLPYEEAITVLMHFKGVGRWTAEYVLMRGLGASDSIPAADVGLRSIIGHAYDLGRAATEVEVRTFAARWAPWRGWASFYWWMALQMGQR